MITSDESHWAKVQIVGILNPVKYSAAVIIRGYVSRDKDN